jgi:WD40 repeat protein
MLAPAQVLVAAQAGAQHDPRPSLTIKEGVDGTTCLAFSPDGKVLAAGNGKDGRVRFWELPSGKLLKQVLTHPSVGMIMNDVKIAFSPDGLRLASLRLGKDNGVRLWDWHTGKESLQVTGVQWPGDLAFTGDAKTLLIVDARSIIVFDLDKMKSQSIPYEDGAYYSFLAVSPDGKQAAVNGFGFSRIRILDLAAGKEVRLLKTEVGFCTALYWTKNGKALITAGVRHPIVYRSAVTGEALKTVGSRENALAGRLPTLTVSSDEKLLAVGDRASRVTVWDAETSKHLALDNHEMPTLSPDNKCLAVVNLTGNAPELHVWQTVQLRKLLK